MRKKIIIFILILGIILIYFVLLFFKEYKLQGTYQGEVEGILYTISFNNNRVNYFSTRSKEHLTSERIIKLDKNKYKIEFEDNLFLISIYSDKEIKLLIKNNEYTFVKKSDVEIWEAGYEYKK